KQPLQPWRESLLAVSSDRQQGNPYRGSRRKRSCVGSTPGTTSGHCWAWAEFASQHRHSDLRLGLGSDRQCTLCFLLAGDSLTESALILIHSSLPGGSSSVNHNTGL